MIIEKNRKKEINSFVRRVQWSEELRFQPFVKAKFSMTVVNLPLST